MKEKIQKEADTGLAIRPGQPETSFPENPSPCTYTLSQELNNASRNFVQNYQFLFGCQAEIRHYYLLLSHWNGPPVSGPVSAGMSILSSDFFVFGKISHSDAGEQVQKLAFCDLTCFGPHGIIFSYFIQPLMTDGSVEHHTE